MLTLATRCAVGRHYEYSPLMRTLERQKARPVGDEVASRWWCRGGGRSSDASCLEQQISRGMAA